MSNFPTFNSLNNDEKFKFIMFYNKGEMEIYRHLFLLASINEFEFEFVYSLAEQLYCIYSRAGGRNREVR